MPEKKIAFIINPKAGVKKKINIPDFIREHTEKGIDYEIFLWDALDRFSEIEKKIFENKFTIVVAVGGDGTVNRVASMVNNTEISLGILPFGSGNGLARSIGVNMDIKKALKQICSGTIKKVDSALINNKQFFCTAGVGFDAHIGKLFAQTTTRGFKTYFNITRKELFSYIPHDYEITVDGIKKSFEAFLITVGNAGQWGNNVFICPPAKMDDGLLHVTVLKKFPKTKIISIVGKLFRRKIHTSDYVEILCGKTISIRRKESGAAHYDGEPETMDEEIQIEIKPGTLKVIS
jgi:diacylglycerol kinase (ATP)